MSLFWALYFIDVTGNIKTSCGFLCAFAMIMNVTWFVANMSEYNHDRNKRAIFRHLLVLIFSLALLMVSVAIPGSNTMYSMLAVKCAERMNLGEEIPKKVIMVIDKKLDSCLKEE